MSMHEEIMQLRIKRMRELGKPEPIYKCEVCLKSHSNEFSLTCETCDFKRESEGLTLEGEDA